MPQRLAEDKRERDRRAAQAYHKVPHVCAEEREVGEDGLHVGEAVSDVDARRFEASAPSMHRSS